MPANTASYAPLPPPFDGGSSLPVFLFKEGRLQVSLSDCWCWDGSEDSDFRAFSTGQGVDNGS